MAAYHQRERIKLLHLKTRKGLFHLSLKMPCHLFVIRMGDKQRTVLRIGPAETVFHIISDCVDHRLLRMIHGPCLCEGIQQGALDLQNRFQPQYRSDSRSRRV